MRQVWLKRRCGWICGYCGVQPESGSHDKLETQHNYQLVFPLILLEHFSVFPNPGTAVASQLRAGRSHGDDSGPRTYRGMPYDYCHDTKQ